MRSSMRFAVLALLILYWDVSLVTAQTPPTRPVISEEVSPVQEAAAGQVGTGRGFLGVERLVSNGPTGVSATKGFVLPAVGFDPSPDFLDRRAAIDVAVTVEVQAGASGVARGDESEVRGRSRAGLVGTLSELFAPRSLVGDFVHLATSKDTLVILGTGLAAGGLINRLGADAAANDFFAADERLSGGVTGALDTIGTSWVMYPAAIATYFLGRALGQPEVRSTGAKLVQGLLVTDLIVTVTKRLTGRMRPDHRSDLSLPSGHTADSFMIATILQHDYGWKLGVPAYALAGLMGASRLDANRHFLSDVIVGAAIGFVVGRTVSGRLERRGIRVGVVGAPTGGVGIGAAMDISVAVGHFATH
ncbi:MAG: phosphatase PAP2 family protein [Acidobacteria bacterium]|nr:phosphatase PAP2 family protein [Acidobacteriota bacterium]